MALRLQQIPAPVSPAACLRRLAARSWIAALKRKASALERQGKVVEAMLFLKKRGL